MMRSFARGTKAALAREVGRGNVCAHFCSIRGNVPQISQNGYKFHGISIAFKRDAVNAQSSQTEPYFWQRGGFGLSFFHLQENQKYSKMEYKYQPEEVFHNE